jgi:hypothetical protein
MSTLIYGALNAQRKAAPKGKSKDEKPPAFGSYIDVVAALVPAEILAVNVALLQKLSDSSTSKTGDPVTKVPNPSDLRLVFWLSIVVSVFLYLIGEWTRARTEAEKVGKSVTGGRKPWKEWSWLRAFVPAAAYVVWAMLEQPSAFDGVANDLAEGTRLVIAVFAALVLAGLAKLLSDQADDAEPDAAKTRRRRRVRKPKGQVEPPPVATEKG